MLVTCPTSLSSVSALHAAAFSGPVPGLAPPSSPPGCSSPPSAISAPPSLSAGAPVRMVSEQPSAPSPASASPASPANSECGAETRPKSWGRTARRKVGVRRRFIVGRRRFIVGRRRFIVGRRSGSSKIHRGSSKIHRGSSKIHRGSSKIHRGSSKIHRGSSKIHRGSSKIHRGSSKIHRGSLTDDPLIRHEERRALTSFADGGRSTRRSPSREARAIFTGPRPDARGWRHGRVRTGKPHPRPFLRLEVIDALRVRAWFRDIDLGLIETILHVSDSCFEEVVLRPKRATGTAKPISRRKLPPSAGAAAAPVEDHR